MNIAIQLPYSGAEYVLRNANAALADAVRWHLLEMHARAASRGIPLNEEQELAEARRLDIRLRHLCGARELIETRNLQIHAQRAYRELERIGNVFERFIVEAPPPPRNGGLAEARAHTTLLRHLNEVQRRDWYHQKAFQVNSQYGGSYAIERKTTSNVIRLTDMRRFCVVFQDMAEFPPSDLWLAQKLLLECDERRFLRVAQGSFVVQTTVPPVAPRPAARIDDDIPF